MTSVTLNSALSGLKAAQKALDTISTNISNAQTVGYTRKILPQESQVVGGSVVGVQVNSLVRNVDKFLMRDMYRQTSVTQTSTVQQKYLSQIQDFHGASDAERSLSSAIGNLSSAFTSLSASPDNQILLNDTVTQAQQVAKKFNDFYALLNNLRQNAENEIASNVALANEQIAKIADLNEKINRASSAGQDWTNLADQRDIAVKELSKYIEISTFESENNKIVVMTKQGQTLADEKAHKLVFQQSQILPGSSYDDGSLNGLYIDDPVTGIAVNQGKIGGSLGGLFTLRDETLPTYMAQADELAQKTAERFDAIGLRLFTNEVGSVPASSAPPAPVSYVGFAGSIRVNTQIVNDPTLLRSGTYGATILPGSNEIISKVTDYVFGNYAYQQASGTANISAGTIFGTTGLTTSNRVIGNMDITDYGADLTTAPNITAGTSFDLTVNGTTYNIVVGAGDSATDLVNNINATVGSNVASLNNLGQLSFSATSDITIADNDIGVAGLADLGLTPGTTLAKNPSFTVQVGGQSPVTVSIAPGDTATDLLATLNAIPGLSASLDGSGRLVMAPTRGGDLTITNASGDPISALGLTISSIGHPSFRTDNMGPAGSINLGLVGSASIGDFSRSMLSAQAEDASIVDDSVSKESTFLSTLEQRNSDISGVDIDQELSELIRVQTAYSAAGRMIAASEQMLDDLINAFFS